MILNFEIKKHKTFRIRKQTATTTTTATANNQLQSNPFTSYSFQIRCISCRLSFSFVRCYRISCVHIILQFECIVCLCSANTECSDYIFSLRLSLFLPFISSRLVLSYIVSTQHGMNAAIFVNTIVPFAFRYSAHESRNDQFSAFNFVFISVTKDGREVEGKKERGRDGE